MSKEKLYKNDTRITTAQAKKNISEMNLINGFLFDSTMESTGIRCRIRQASGFCLYRNLIL